MRLLILTQKMDEQDDNLGFFHRWVEEFARQCEFVIVVCLYEGVHHLPENVRVLSLGKEEGVSRFKYLRRFYTYIWSERRNYDAVFVHMNQIYVVLGGFLWRTLGKRVSLWYAHGKTSLSLYVATVLSNRVFTSTPEGFRIKTPKRMIVGQGIDSSLFVVKTNRSVRDAVRLVTAGRITPAKHLEDMIDAVETLAQRDVPVTLDVFGSGDAEYVELLKMRSQKGNANQSVRFRGGVSYKELCNTLATYDVFVNLGTTGSLDKAILDALAAGLPVITTNSAVQEFVVGKNIVESVTQIWARKQVPPEPARRGLSWVAEEHSLERLIRAIVSMV